MKPGPGQRIPVFTTAAQIEEHLKNLNQRFPDNTGQADGRRFVPMTATEAYEYARLHGIPPAGNRAPDRMRPEETDAKWFENPRRLPWCAVCNKTIAHVKVTRMLISGDREFIVECHGATERTVLSDGEVKKMTGYGRAFAAEGARDV